ncbi:unnamed protein product [Rotaria sp. Silwood2]|nr:unnamed protein product [Rotaria sp. Silwood2]
MEEFNVKNFLFSSSATVYGSPKYLPLDEKHPCTGDAITNPYGKSDSNKLQVLVPGGIDFIGSHCVIELINTGYECIIVDNLSNSVEQIVGCKITNYKIDCLDLDSLRDVFKKHSIYAIMNFAALKSVSESIEKPVFIL